MLPEFDSENADRDLTGQVTVLTHTPNASNAMFCNVYVECGDGAKNLDGTGGDFELTITVGGVTIQPDPQTIAFSTAVRSGVLTSPFPVRANKEVVVKIKSPNAGDNDVDVVATLFNIGGALGIPVALDSGTATIAGMLTKLADDNGGADYDATTDSQEKIASRVANIGSGGTGAINVEITNDNVLGALKGIAFVGTQAAGTFASLANDPTDYQQINNAAGNIDIVYYTNVGGNKEAVNILLQGYLDKKDRTGIFQAYDFVGSTWDTMYTLEGTNGGENVNEPAMRLSSKHTGTGAELGDVYVRFTTVVQADADLFNGVLLIQAVNISESVGYSVGRIWGDTVNGAAGTVPHRNGTADNPSLTWADMLTLSASIGLKSFNIANGSTIELSANSDNYSMYGAEWNLQLSDESMANMFVEMATVTGVGTGSAARFFYCKMGLGASVTLPACGMMTCMLGGDIILSSAGTYLMTNCFSGSVAPSLDFGAGVGNTTVHLTGYKGSVEIENFGRNGTDEIHITGDADLTINANCVGGTIHLIGNIEYTDNVVGGFVAGGGVILQDARYDVTQVQVAAAAALTAYDPSTNTEMNARTLPTADYGTSSGQTTINNNVITVDNVVDAIKVIVDNLPNGGSLNDLAAILTDSAWLVKAAEGDVDLDTSGTTFEEVIKEKDTANELIRKKLYQADETAVTSTDHLVGKKLESAP